MRLSQFKIKMLWLIILIILNILSFNVNINYIPIATVCKIISLISILIWSIDLSNSLRNIVSYKYRLTEKQNHCEVKYLTVWWLFIPYWRPIKKKYVTSTGINFFGGEIPTSYSIEKTYEFTEEAIMAIKYHKEMSLENRKNWFKNP